VPGGNISVVTPSSGDILALSKPHIIRWSRAADSLGVITLIDASSKNVVGWIAATIAPQQVTHSWDTRTVAVGPASAASREVAPGSYIVRIAFGNSKTTIESGPFTIAVTNDERFAAREAVVRNSLFVPNSIALTRAQRLAVVNNEDTASHTLLLNGIAITTLAPRSSYVFEGSQYPAGRYEFGLGGHPLAHLTVIVQ
jgi:hypothetical protein